METREMTLVTIVAERLLRDSVVQRIREAGARGFTQTNVSGEGTRGVHAHEFEGPSVKIETLVPDAVAAKIVDEIAERYFEHHAVIVYTTEARIVRGKKF